MSDCFFCDPFLFAHLLNGRFAYPQRCCFVPLLLFVPVSCLLFRIDVFLITFDWDVLGDLSLVAIRLFKWVMISLHLSFSSPLRLPSPDPPRILAVFPMFSSHSFHRYPAPLLLSPFLASVSDCLLYGPRLFFCIPLSPHLTSSLSVSLFLTRVSQSLQTV